MSVVQMQVVSQPNWWLVGPEKNVTKAFLTQKPMQVAYGHETGYASQNKLHTVSDQPPQLDVHACILAPKVCHHVILACHVLDGDGGWSCGKIEGERDMGSCLADFIQKETSAAETAAQPLHCQAQKHGLLA